MTDDAGAGPDYQSLVFDYVRSPDQDAAEPARHPIIVVGAGPVGLVAAIDLAQRGAPVLLLDDDDTLSKGSRAICFSKRTLEIFDRLGCGQRMVDKGVTWNRGKVFFRDDAVYGFDLLPESGHRRPAFVNLQQYYVEGYLVELARSLPNLEIRWKHRLVSLVQDESGAELGIETPDGRYRLRCDWLVAADGARSTARNALGLTSKGQSFRDRFLIADVRMTADFPTERWFWFHPPFHPEQSVLLHKQPDGVWRVDFQLGWDADPVAEQEPARVIPRITALLGPDVPFTLEWVSVYTFSCLRMDRFRHGRVIFAGDSAHGVSPFGARGANSGIQDADNLGWKLALVAQGRAPAQLLDSYDSERQAAADENIRHSTRSTDFITPKNEASRAFRDAVLDLSRDCGFARRLVNSGRLSLPSTYDLSPLNTADEGGFVGDMIPGAPVADAPVSADGQETWLLTQLGPSFSGIYFADPVGPEPALLGELLSLRSGAIAVEPIIVIPRSTCAPPAGIPALVDSEGLLASRFDARPGSFYLLRPDQHVCARWRAFDAGAVRAALRRAICDGRHGHAEH